MMNIKIKECFRGMMEDWHVRARLCNDV